MENQKHPRSTNNDVAEAIGAAMLKVAEFIGNLSTAVAQQRGSPDLFPELKDVLARLAKEGWFVSGYFGLSEISDLDNHCVRVANSEWNSLMAGMYRSSLKEHCESLIKDYPQRAFAIKPAIEAHNRGEYALSVPVFYAQAEGICFDALGKYIFMNKKGPGGVDENIKSTALERIRQGQLHDPANLAGPLLSAFTEFMWLPFAETLPIGYNAKERKNFNYEGLNRNTLMHGLDLTYATEENSLKAFSMLSHVGALVHDLSAYDIDYASFSNS